MKEPKIFVFVGPDHGKKWLHFGTDRDHILDKKNLDNKILAGKIFNGYFQAFKIVAAPT